MSLVKNKMKKTTFNSFLYFSINTVNSQLFTKEKVINNENFDKPSMSWGYFLGLNNYDFNFDYKQDLKDIQVDRTLLTIYCVILELMIISIYVLNLA